MAMVPVIFYGATRLTGLWGGGISSEGKNLGTVDINDWKVCIA